MLHGLLGHAHVLARRRTVLLLDVSDLPSTDRTFLWLTDDRFDIGLFGLVGMLGVLVGPFIGRLIDRLIPWYATLVATFLLLAFQTVQTAGGGINVSAVVVACQMQQVSLATRVLR
jgi:hypothetical protein